MAMDLKWMNTVCVSWDNKIYAANVLSVELSLCEEQYIHVYSQDLSFISQN